MIGLSHQPQYVPAFSSIPGFGSNGKHNIHRRRLKFKGKCAFLPPSFFVGCFCSYKKKSVIISERWDSLKVFHKVVCHRRNISSSVIRNDSFSDSDVDPSGNDEDMFAEKSGHLQSIKKDFFEFTRSFGSQLRPGSYQAEILFLALPAIIGQAIEPMAQLAETAYIGRLGAIELASAGVSITIFNIISKLFNVPLLSITTSFVAKDISIYSNHESISDTMLKIQPLPSVSTALLLSLCIGTIEGLALLFGAGQFLKMLGVAVNNEGQCPNYKFGETKKIKWEMSLLTHQHFPFGYVSDNRLDILPQEASPMYGPAQQFLSLRALGAPAVVVSLAIQGIFRGFKDTRTPLLWIGFGNLSAVCMLPIFLYTLQLGLNGAAVATVASQYITTVMLIWALSRKALLMPPRLADLQFGGYIKSGSMLLGRTLSVLITMTLGTSMAARQGPVAMAAHQICLQVWLAVSLLSDALALSAQAIIASSFAKHDHKRVKDIASFVLKCGMLIGMTLAIVLSLSFGSLAHLFTKDSNVLQIVKSGILFVSASQPINAIAFIFDGLHYGVSDFSYAACSMMVVGAISSVFLLYVPSKFGLPGVWSGLTLFMTLRMVAGFLRLKWKNGPWNFLQEDPVI